MPSTEERLTRVETMFENADRTITEIRADTAQKITEMRADTAQKIAEMRADTAQKIAEMRADTDRKIAEWRAETAQRIAEDREREERRHAETAQRIAEDRERTERQTAELRAEIREATVRNRADLDAAVDRMRTFTISTIVAIFIGVAAMIVGMFQLTARDHDRYDAHLKESAERFESLERDFRERGRDLPEDRIPLRTTVGR